jgi:hypothetical protein
MPGDGGDGLFTISPTANNPLLLLLPSPMASHKVKIAARLRPRLDGEVVDDNIKVFHNGDTSTGSTNSTSGGSHISVVNPRDTTQVFKFP